MFLQCLYLEGNHIEELDELFFPSLQSLQWLDLRNNRLCTLPKTIAHHPNLQVLLLQENKIETLPLELGNYTFCVREYYNLYISALTFLQTL